MLQQLGAYRPIHSAYIHQQSFILPHKYRDKVLTLQIEVSAPLTRYLSIAFDLASLAFITGAFQDKPSAINRNEYNPLPLSVVRHIKYIPSNGDITIPLTARMRSVGLFRFPFRPISLLRWVLWTGTWLGC